MGLVVGLVVGLAVNTFRTSHLEGLTFSRGDSPSPGEVDKGGPGTQTLQLLGFSRTGARTSLPAGRHLLHVDAVSALLPLSSASSDRFQVELLGDCDDVFGYLADRIGLNVSVAKDATSVAKDATSADLPFASGATIAEAVTVLAGTDAGAASGTGYLVTENPFNERSVAICLEQVV